MHCWSDNKHPAWATPIWQFTDGLWIKSRRHISNVRYSSSELSLQPPCIPELKIGKLWAAWHVCRSWRTWETRYGTMKNPQKLILNTKYKSVRCFQKALLGAWVMYLQFQGLSCHPWVLDSQGHWCHLHTATFVETAAVANTMVSSHATAAVDSSSAVCDVN